MNSNGITEEKSAISSYSNLSFFPIEHPKLHKFYDLLMRLFWRPTEINWTGDRDDWDTLDNNTREFLQFFLFFFAQFDGIVNENLFHRFKKETRKYKEAAHFYALQEANETVHNQVYSLMIETFIRDDAIKEKGFNAIQHYPSIRAISDWIEQYMHKSRPLLERVVAFACLEGILFTGAFATIYWIKKSNKLHALDTANQWIARDERIHLEFAVELYHQLKIDADATTIIPTEERVKTIISSAVDVAAQFIQTALKVDLIGMNAEDLVAYVKTTANGVCTSLKVGHVYPGQVNPLDWMVVIGLANKSNFFEQTVTEYAAPKEAGDSTNNNEFDLGADF